MNKQTTLGTRLRTDNRWIIGSMLLLMALGYFGQITFVISLIVIALIHKLRKSTWAELGLTTPTSWIKTILVSMLFTAVIFAIILGLDPMIRMLADQPADISRFDMFKGNVWMLIGVILSIWISAAFGEELIWRGYIMKNVAELLGDNRKAWIVSLITSSVLFGLLHYYQGPAGMIQTGLAGLLLGMVYMRNNKRNLWVNILVHGLMDTVSMIYIFMS